MPDAVPAVPAGSGRLRPSFDLIAHRYEASPPFLLRSAARRLAAELTRSGGGGLWLDVGAGDGALQVPAVGAGPPVSQVISVDLSAEMLRRLPPGGVPVVARAQALPLRSSTVDLASCANLLPLLPDGAEAVVLGELLRVTRVGGRLGVGWVSFHPEDWSWLLDREGGGLADLRRIAAVHERWAGQGRVRTVVFDVAAGFTDPAHFLRWRMSTGFGVHYATLSSPDRWVHLRAVAAGWPVGSAKLRMRTTIVVLDAVGRPAAGRTGSP